MSFAPPKREGARSKICAERALKCGQSGGLSIDASALDIGELFDRARTLASCVAAVTVGAANVVAVVRTGLSTDVGSARAPCASGGRVRFLALRVNSGANVILTRRSSVADAKSVSEALRLRCMAKDETE